MNANGHTVSTNGSTPEPPVSSGPLELSLEILGELFAGIPKLIDRSHAQLELVRSVAGHLPCLGRLAAPPRARRDDETRQPTPSIDVLTVVSAGATVAERSTDAVDPAPTSEHVEEIAHEGELAVPDYDSLAASQVVPRLSSMSHDELESIQRYELAHRNRQTILNRVAQLLAR